MYFGNSEISKLCRTKEYDKLIAFNVENSLSRTIYNRNKNNKGFEYHCIEDAPNIYIPYVPKKNSIFHPYRIMGLEQEAFNITKWWGSWFDDDKMPNEYNSGVNKLPTIKSDDTDYVKTMNYIFSYVPDEDLQQADLLFMEESHFTDGHLPGNQDFQLYNEIRRRYPNKKCLVKLHPRTKVNRFANDFHVMKNSSIPWELYVLNMLNQNKEFIPQIGIICSSMFSDKLMFGAEGKKILLAPLFYDYVLPGKNGERRVREELVKYFEDFRNQYKEPDNFIIAHEKEEIFCALDRMFS